MIRNGKLKGLVSLTLLAGCLSAAGCQAPWNPWPLWHSWLDPTRVIAVTDDEADLIAIFDHVDPMEEHQEVFPNAEPPVLEDLSWSDSDYTVGPGDVLLVSILDLYAEGQEAALQRQVTNAGYIDLPFIDRIQVRGLTTYQIAEEIRRAYQPDYLLNPVVNVSPLATRENYYSMTGAVARPNWYPIPRRDFRLLEALAIAGDVTQPNLEYAYIIRPTEAVEALRRPAEPMVTPPPPTMPEHLPPLPGWEPDDAPPADPATPYDDLLRELEQYMPGSEERPAEPEPPVQPGVVTAPATRPEQQLSLPEAPADPETEMQGLRDAMAPGSPTPSTRPVQPTVLRFSENEPPVGGAVPASGAAGGTPRMVWSFEGGQWVQVPVESPGSEDDTAPGGAWMAPQQVVDHDDPFGWAQADLSGMARIIAINLPKLMEGSPSQNIVIRDGDIIVVPPLKIGQFYVTGEVNRPGPYDLTGRKVTVKMALAHAQGLNPIAWPSNSVLVRRIGTNQELRIPLRLDRIMAGKEPEILLKPDDMIMVGSHITAPFLAVIRNSFRMTYGVGFIYDRNFAERNFGQYQGFDNVIRDAFSF